MARSAETDTLASSFDRDEEQIHHPAPGRSYLGVGLYSLPEAARLLHMPGATLRRWLAGSGAPVEAGQRDAGPLVWRENPELVADGLLTFSELIELLFIRQLRRADVPLRTIRSIAREAGAALQTPHPFADRRFYTHRPPRHVPNEPLSQPLSPGSPEREIASAVVVTVIEAFARQLDYADNQVCRYWPLGKSRCVVLDPARAFGQPADPASGVPTRVLNSAYAAGEPVEEVARWYRVDPQAVRDAVEFQ